MDACEPTVLKINCMSERETMYETIDFANEICVRKKGSER